MPIRLADVLKHSTLTPADPVIRAAAAIAAQTQLRWIHSSEVLDIAPLLGGGELLLTGGQALVAATDKRRIGYIWELAERGVAALAIETGTALPSIPSSMVGAAEAGGFPLIELRKVVPFVGVMEAINSLLVSESAAHLQQADRASHAMAVELAHGGSLDRILAVLADATGAEVVLTSNAGAPLASALPAGFASAAGPGRPPTPSRTGPHHPYRRFRAGHTFSAPEPAHLGGRRCEPGEDCREPFGGHPGPGPAAAHAARPEGDGGRRADPGRRFRHQQLAAPTARAGCRHPPGCAAGGHRDPVPGSRQLRTAVEQLLDRAGRHSASYADNEQLLALAVLRTGKTQEDRNEILAGLRTLELPEGASARVGPVASGDLGRAVVADRGQVDAGRGVGRRAAPGRARGFGPAPTPRPSPRNGSPPIPWTSCSGRILSVSSSGPSWSTTSSGIRPW